MNSKPELRLKLAESGTTVKDIKMIQPNIGSIDTRGQSD